MTLTCLNADPRVADWLMMGSPLQSLLICIAYLIFVAFGPTIMAGRKPLVLKNVLIVYNIAMVGMSTFCFVEVSTFSMCFVWEGCAGCIGENQEDGEGGEV